jgi:murein tripeptide amidase MpaA
MINFTEYGGWGWFKIIQPVYSYTNTFCGTDWKRITNVKDAVYTNNLFTFTQTFTAETVWVAPTFPFPHTQCYEWIGKLNTTSPYVRASVVGRSQQGRDMIVATVTDFAVPTSNKKVIWFISGQHPCETSGQIALKTMTDWLLSADPLAVSYRRKYEFHMVYEMNPDGNYLGNYRLDSLGRNLNTYWGSNLKPPEVKCIYALVNNTIHNGGKVDLWVDWHGSSRTYNFQYAISNVTTSISPQLRASNTRLTALVQQYATGPTEIVSNYAGYGVSHDQMAKDFGINAITIEQGLARLDTIETIRQFGLNVLTAVNEYFNRP